MSELRAKYLDPDLLSKLGSLQLKATALAEGIIAGLHRSPHRGGSVEFSEYSEYSPGHEIRHIDWKVFGKSDKYYVKQFQDETNLRTYFVLDGSGSMNYASEDAPFSKLEYVCLLAAAIAHLYIHQGDAVGALNVSQDGTARFLPASSKKNHLEDLFYLFDHLPAAGTYSLNTSLRSIAERTKSRCQIIVMGDMMEADQETINLLGVLRKRRYEIALFHVVDPAELTLPFEGMTLFEDMELDDELLADPDELRDRYIEAFREHLAWVKLSCEKNQIEYHRFVTTDALHEVALRYLRARI